ncbi:UNVERIFIED_CONTAM: hypothetical protein GTU68_043273 [Idotea baltica]|nr:hypothetical protein [Idotea baltica]
MRSLVIPFPTASRLLFITRLPSNSIKT